ncbi:MAG: hypothetical protein Tsb009_11000 [Planctomycetaceae bacterium]
MMSKKNSATTTNSARFEDHFQELTDPRRREYNKVRPHSALGYRSPAPEAFGPYLPASATLQRPNTESETNTTHPVE